LYILLEAEKEMTASKKRRRNTYFLHIEV